jgi:uncharacterized membrane protein
MEHVLPRKNKKMSAQSRLLYGLAGGALVGYGIKYSVQRAPWLGSLTALVGVDLLTHGATGHHLHEALGITDGYSQCAKRRGFSRIPHQLGVQIQRCILVDSTPQKAYEFVRDLENFPRFMQHVKTIYFTGEKRCHWVVKGPAGTQLEWDADIINDIPGELIAWRSINNPDIDSAGSIRFEKASDDRGTIIRVHMQYLPPAGAVGVAIAKLFGEEPAMQMRSDLRRLKQILESGEVATTAGQPVGGQGGLRSRSESLRQTVEVRSSSRPAGLLTEDRRAAAASGHGR